jgi:hypothetical protein
MPVHKPEEAELEADISQSASKRRKNDQNGETQKESSKEKPSASATSNGSAMPTPGKGGELGKDEDGKAEGKEPKSAKKSAASKDRSSSSDDVACNGTVEPTPSKASKGKSDAHQAEAKDQKSAQKQQKNGKEKDVDDHSSHSNGAVSHTPMKASKSEDGHANKKDSKEDAIAQSTSKKRRKGENGASEQGAGDEVLKPNKDKQATPKKADKHADEEHSKDAKSSQHKKDKKAEKAKRNSLNGTVKSPQSAPSSGKKHRSNQSQHQDPNAGSPDEAEPREEIKVHMARFLQYQPSGITAIAHDDVGERLAVARDNGDIQLWSTSLPRWHPVATLAGTVHSKIRSLCWSRYKAEDCPGGARLFSASLSGHIAEWSLGSLMPVHVADTYGGAAWCMAASPDQSMLAVGCHDGMCRLFSVTEDSGPLFHKSLPPHPGQVHTRWTFSSAVL